MLLFTMLAWLDEDVMMDRSWMRGADATATSTEAQDHRGGNGVQTHRQQTQGHSPDELQGRST